MTEKRGRGRPAVDNEKRAGAVVTIRVTKAEKEALDSLAKASGVTTSAYTKALIGRHIKRKK